MIKHWCDVCNDEMTEEIYYFEVRIEAKAPCGIPYINLSCTKSIGVWSCVVIVIIYCGDVLTRLKRI